MPEWDTLVAGPEQTALAGVDVAQVFAASYRKLVVQLYGIVGNASEAEDLVQEAFVRAYAAGPRFTRVDNPEAWLRTTAVNLYRNRWRKMRNFARIKHRLEQPPDLPEELRPPVAIRIQDCDEVGHQSVAVAPR